MEIIKINELFKKIFTFFRTTEIPSTELTSYRIAVENGLDRRKSSRIVCPEVFNIENMPHILCEGFPIKIQDISLGGMCLLDELNHLNSSAGNIVNLEFIWSDQTIIQPSLIVGIGYNKKHLKFLNLHPYSFVKLNIALKPGFLGLKMRNIISIASLQKNHIHIKADEIWMGQTGESLVVFPRSDSFSSQLGEIKFYGHTIIFYENSLPVYKYKTDKYFAGQKISLSLIDDLIMFILNIKPFSPSIDKILNVLLNSRKSYQEIRSEKE